MEGDGTSLHFALLDVDFVPTEDNGDFLANSLEITVPVWHIFIGDARRDVEHDDTALTLDIVAITESTKLLLPCCIPHIETNGTKVGRKVQGMYFNTQCCNVLLFKLSSQVTLDESRLACTSIANYTPLDAIVKRKLM